MRAAAFFHLLHCPCSSNSSHTCHI